MTFGKRHGWREGILLVHGRVRARCRVLQQSRSLLVLEVGEGVALPYQFSLLLDGENIPCEFKFQRNTIVTAIPFTPQQHTAPLEGPPRGAPDDAGQWAGWRHPHGYKR